MFPKVSPSATTFRTTCKMSRDRGLKVWGVESLFLRCSPSQGYKPAIKGLGA